MASPYENQPVEQWDEITKKLISDHPLDKDQLLETAISSWEQLWSTRVGGADVGVPLVDLDPPATVVGYFFEKIFSKRLAEQLPGQWRGGKGSEKDLHCITKPEMSVEMKSSGQVGYKIFGNRSYGQKNENAEAVKKDKSGYYVTINFHKQALTMLRFGWIDGDDWQAQKSATGQMAGLVDSVYSHKLIEIPGDHMLGGPVQLLDKVGPKKAKELEAAGFKTIGDLVRAKDVPSNLEKIRSGALERYGHLL